MMEAANNLEKKRTLFILISEYCQDAQSVKEKWEIKLLVDRLSDKFIHMLFLSFAVVCFLVSSTRMLLPVDISCTRILRA